jgi:cytochrome c1
LALAATLAAFTLPALAADQAEHPEDYKFTFEGPFGEYDRAQLQRGFQVYQEVCATCHGLEHLAFRHLGEPGGPFEAFRVRNHETGEEEITLTPHGHGARRVDVNENPYIRAIAANAKFPRINPETGLEEPRDGLPTDSFPRPFANEALARAANAGSLPPDLSVITSARHGGAEYIRSLLMGYTGETVDGRHVNHYFPGGLIAMPAPLTPDRVTYQDGTPASVEQMATDVTAFLHWAADPHLEARNKLGMMSVGFLLVLSFLLYLAYKQVWRGEKH